MPERILFTDRDIGGGGGPKSLRVLVTTDAVGELWTYSLDLARGLSRLGVETVLAMIGPSPGATQIRAAAAVRNLNLVETGLPLERLAADPHAVTGAGEALARLARRQQVDLVQLNSPVFGAEADFPVPVVAVAHSCLATWWEAVHETELPEDFAWRTDLDRAGLHAADAVVTTTAALGEAVMARYELAEVPRVVHNGRTPLTLPRIAPHDFVFTAGRLWDEGENLDTLDGAAGGLAVPLRAAGPLKGPNGGVMFDNIHCLGSLEEAALARWLAARPVFVSAALYEPFGLAVLEAAAAGCALILSDIPAFRELWDHCAVFVAPRDKQGFARAIENLVGDDFERAVMGHAAKDRAGRYTPDAMAAQMVAIYRSLLPAVRRPVLAAARAAA